jgi:two-component system NtrC family sensor kinase
MRDLPQAARWYLTGLWSLALVAALGSLAFFWNDTITFAQLLAALIFATMLTAADLTAFETEDGRTVSIAVALLLAGITALNWPLLLAVIVIGTVSAGIARDLDWWQIVSLIAIRCITFVLAAAIGLLHGATGVGELGSGVLPYTTIAALLALLTTGALVFLIERAADAGLEFFREGVPFRDALRLRSVELRWYVLLLAPLGGLLAILWQTSGVAFVLGIVPLVIVQNTFRNQSERVHYGNEVRQLAADSSALSHKLERLQSLMIALITTRDASVMLQILCDRLAELMQAANGWVVLYDEQQQLMTVASYQLPIAADRPGPVPVPLPRSYEAVLERQRVTLFTDQHRQSLAPLPELSEGLYWNALVCIPLVDEKRVMGAICLTFAEVRGLSADEQRVLMAFARQAATVIQNARLFRRLQESQAELIQSSKLAAVGTFASGIAHEFNNLLAGMLGYAQLGLANADSAAKNESFQVVIDACRRGKSITGSLLTFARRRAPRRELADLFDAIQGTLTLMELELRKHHIVIERRLNPIPPTICDSGQIAQVFLNLLTNARDAMKSDGGKLTVSLDGDDQQITLAVSDTGSGIPDEIRDKIFEPFITTKGALGGSATPGTGLGLSVSYGIVRSHGGLFQVQSVPGEGTTMIVTLPVVQDVAQANALAEADPQSSELPDLRLLIVDDDPAFSRSLQGLLEHIGHRVSVCENAEAALAQYQHERFDMVLTDLAMPGMSGMDLVRALRDYDPEVCVLVFSGVALDAQVQAALQAGARAVLRKPFDLQEVLRAMQKAYLQARPAAVDQRV